MDPERTISPPKTRFYRPHLWLRLLVSAMFGGGGVCLLAVGAKMVVAPSGVPFGSALLVLAAFGCYVPYAVQKTRVEITEDRVRDFFFFRMRELRFDDIQGYRFRRGGNETHFFLIPKNDTGWMLRIDPEGMNDSEELATWIRDNFSDFDEEECRKELDAIAHDERFGRTEAERMALLAKAKGRARALAVGSLLLMLWGLVFPHPYGLVVGALLVLPLASLFLVAISKGLVRIGGGKGHPQGVVLPGLLVPAIVLPIRTIIDWHLVEWQPVLAPLLVLTGGMIILSIFWAPEIRSSIGNFLSIAFACAIISGCAVVHINCYYDLTTPVRYRTTVRQIYVTHGKSTTYSMTLNPWRDGMPVETVPISAANYSQLRQGSRVTALEHRGSLGIPWFSSP